jgi:hypothetical protein
VELNDRQLALVLAGLFELPIAYVEGEECQRATVLAAKLGGDLSVMFFGAGAAAS